MVSRAWDSPLHNTRQTQERPENRAMKYRCWKCKTVLDGSLEDFLKHESKCDCNAFDNIEDEAIKP
jgi:hypothetical protein